MFWLMLWFICLSSSILVSLTVKALVEATRAIPKDVAWAGQNVRGPFKQARSFLASVFGTRALIEDGYVNYSRKGLPFVLPNLFTGPEIMLPPDQAEWIHDQPNENLSIFEAERQFMRADYTLLNPTIINEHIFQDAIKIQLTRKLNDLAPSLADEIENALSALFDQAPGDWVVVDGYHAWKKIMIQTISRIYVGLPLCRNEEYLYHARHFNGIVMVTAGLIGLIPDIFQKTLAPLLVLHDKYHHWRSSRLTREVIRDRWETISARLSKGHDIKGVPQDLVTWAVLDAMKERSEKANLEFLAQRISVMNFVSIDSTTITVGNTIFDILCWENGRQIWSELEAEARDAFVRHGEAKSQAFVNQLLRLDSVIKESLRMNNFLCRAQVKMIVNEAGIDVPGVGHVPAGIKVGLPVWGMHHDPDTYDNPYAYKPYRFYGDGRSVFETTKTFMAFGYRKSACPGRFLAVRTVKLLMAHLLLNYDVEVLTPHRPRTHWWGVSISPPFEGRLRLRRKPQA